MQLNPTLRILQDLLHLWPYQSIQLVTKRISKHRMNHHSQPSEERILPDPFGSINDLIGDDEMSRSDIFP